MFSAWVPGCAGHGYLTYSFGKHTQVPENSGNDLTTVIHRFLNDEIIFELDPVRYPHNKGCANKMP